MMEENKDQYQYQIRFNADKDCYEVWIIPKGRVCATREEAQLVADTWNKEDALYKEITKRRSNNGRIDQQT